MSTIPVTVLTGFLGAGKTSLVLSLLPKLPRGYRVALLKNEFGDVAVDSLLVQQMQQRAGGGSVAVQEMLNGCVCCVLVGKMSTALREIKERFAPDRVIIETSGSAFPAPIAWQIRELEPEGFVLDAIITLVDCAHFRGYEDRSYTARMQAQYTDLILLNKHEGLSEREMDDVVDRVNDLNTDTPRVRVNVQHGDVGPELVFGLDSRLFCTRAELDAAQLAHDHPHDHHEREVDLIDVAAALPQPPDLGALVHSLAALPKDTVFRIKGTVATDDGVHIVNIAFARPDEPVRVDGLSGVADAAAAAAVRLTIMGDGLRLVLERVRAIFGPAARVVLNERG